MDEADAKAKGTAPARNQTAIDMLQPGDVIVADVFGAEWNYADRREPWCRLDDRRRPLVYGSGAAPFADVSPSV